jgi:hypothetical protein
MELIEVKEVMQVKEAICFERRNTTDGLPALTWATQTQLPDTY